MSSFSSLGIGSSAIHAAQRGLDVTGQNIANSATPGYTRQRVDLESVGGPGVPAFWSRYLGTGEGVKVTGVSRMTDEFLVARARSASAALGDVEEQAKTFEAIERTVNEPSSSGLQAQLADFWNAWGKITNNPSADAPRNTTFERAVAVANQLNHVSNALHTQWQDTRAQVLGNVTNVNSMAQDIASLNRAIRNNTVAGVPSNELLDQRDRLVSEISRLTGASSRPMADALGNTDNALGAVDVVIGGVKLVEGLNVNVLSLTPAVVTPGVIQPVSLSLTDSSAATVTLTGGSGAGNLKGQLTALNVTLPGYLADFDSIAQQLVTTVNTQQGAGYTVAGIGGAPLFTDGLGGTTVNAGNIAVAGTPADLAVSQGQPPAVLDGNNAMAMARHLSDTGGADAGYSSLVVRLGVQAQSVNRNVEVQSTVVKGAADARDNVSGVSLNEEMTNLIQFQHSFSAAARFITVIDSTIETLLNMAR